MGVKSMKSGVNVNNYGLKRFEFGYTDLIED